MPTRRPLRSSTPTKKQIRSKRIYDIIQNNRQKESDEINEMNESNAMERERERKREREKIAYAAEQKKNSEEAIKNATIKDAWITKWPGGTPYLYNTKTEETKHLSNTQCNHDDPGCFRKLYDFWYPTYAPEVAKSNMQSIRNEAMADQQEQNREHRSDGWGRLGYLGGGRRKSKRKRRRVKRKTKKQRRKLKRRKSKRKKTKRKKSKRKGKKSRKR